VAYRNKTFVSFDGDTDIHYYRLMQAWHQNDNSTFSFYNAHDLNTAADDSQTESIKAQLRERLMNSKTFVLLVGEKTRYLRRFVQWEQEQALRLRLPIIAVNLNGTRRQDPERCPPTIRDELAIYISFNMAIMQYALEHWPASADQLAREGKKGPYYYNEDVYRTLGL
jgi:hypothetical protein